MKALTINGTNYGPYNSIEVLSDRYRCDNTDLPFVVVGQGEIVEADTITWPEPPVPPVPVPESVSPRQIRQAMTQFGLRSVVEESIAGGDQNAKDWYEYATAFERNNPIVLGMAQALGVTSQQLDDLWILAGSL
jgi:hypothetical protein